MEPREVSAPLLRLVARAYFRFDRDLEPPEPNDGELADAQNLIEALASEHLKIVPDDIDEDLTNSEEGA